MTAPAILVLGTADTKADEISFLRECLTAGGAKAAIMDVGVLGEAPLAVDFSRHDVARAAGTTNAAIAALGDENLAMAKTAEGAAALALELCQSGRCDGLIALGGTMATDLALDVTSALPLGLPKVVLSTVAFSPLLPPERLAPDLIMVLWAGGLYGLNSLCRASLSQAAGAVLGAARLAQKPQRQRPVVGLSSLGKTSLSYMVHLKPELESRGYEVAVFHTTGMGGRAMETLAARGQLAALMDFSLVEVSNHLMGSLVSAGADRLEGAGRAGVPQIVAPGGVTLIDMQAWAPVPERFEGREFHAHNRLIACAIMEPGEKRAAARAIAAKLQKATGPTAFIMPLAGIDEWDKPGGPFHDPDGLAAFADEMRQALAPPVELIEIEAHINDRAFADRALAVLDGWVAEGLVVRGEV
ncbi:MAG TPA: Tm-1-like ATP-binding domain-containing protein [Alphaproteobacteria bacterium]|jgi:uncharacterized protein (UPF0261 family)|nr:Tm-1-like ATP-binding domain-containing protein [Alphaproteobacteria bacterium]MDP6270210.1 Tm-1-like ATP-binding domain-containing protein [Alphaproteobacteria bacterium]HJM49734.1 Tm-1-like ATP-binding domain-containing protein [Alphaproteobacteria bacterium]